MQQVSVILPTYNEAENLPVIVPDIVQSLERSGIRGEVIVVDDDSPDNTGGVAAELANRYPVQVLVRKGRRGLASAVVEGFSLSQAEVCVVMDADGSHPVETLPDMVLPVLQGKTDATVGTRYIQDGETDNWPWYRRFISRFAGSLAMGVSKLNDPTSGYMAIRRSILRTCEDIDPIGWKIVLEVIVKKAPLRVLEIPITFRDRYLGESKMSGKATIEYLVHLLKLYAYTYSSTYEFVKFGIVGLSGVFVDMATVILFKELLGLHTLLCAICGFSTAVTSNYYLNRAWTFDQGKSIPKRYSFPRFVLSCLGGLGVRLVVMFLLVAYAGMDSGNLYIVTNFIGITAAVSVNFLGCKLFVFKKKVDNADLAVE